MHLLLKRYILIYIGANNNFLGLVIVYFSQSPKVKVIATRDVTHDIVVIQSKLLFAHSECTNGWASRTCRYDGLLQISNNFQA